ncbi:DUF6460 domain-containing protein [Methylocystis sp. 9N]|uniref:DUF6460 domain-containing protein n=1 Tax=Methylocystis borbori TaxID=3118750 RepID=A0ABU7XHK3_9HYPH
MSDQSPFANWPHLDRPRPPERLPENPAAERDYLILPGSPEYKEETQMASNNAFENFLGGSPLNTFVRLFFISLVVGALLMWLELRPIDILHGVQAFVDRIYQLGFGAVKELFSYVLAGAVFVIPAWLVLRLFNVTGAKR